MRLRLTHDAGGRGEEIAGLVILAAGVLGAAWLKAGFPTPRCVFHAVTGWPCLTCGATRSTRSFLEGDLTAALGWNPLVFAVGAVGAAFVVYAAAVAVLPVPRLRIVNVSRSEGRWIRALVITVVAANWIYLGWRFSGHA